MPYKTRTKIIPKQALKITSESLCAFASILLADTNIASTNDNVIIIVFTIFLELCVTIHIIVFVAKASVVNPLGINLWFSPLCLLVFAIAINDKISPKEKMFLIPQEIADGMVNVGLYYSICQIIKNIGRR